MSSLFDSAEFNGTLFYPRENEAPPPEGAEDLRVDVPGGALNLRWHRTEGSRFTLLLFHGNGETAPDYDRAAPLFAKCGADLVVVDYRGYGLSEGDPTYRESYADARAAAEFAASRSALPLVLMGRSLGSSFISELYAAPPARAAAFVWESGISDLHALVGRRGMEPPEFFSDADLDTFDPLPKLARGRLPFLVLHGEADIHIAPRESRDAYLAAGGERKYFVLIPGKGHNEVASSEVYWQALAEFIAEL